MDFPNFSQSLLAGLDLFRMPPVWIMAILLLILSLGFAKLIRVTTNAEESQNAMAAGCLTQILGLLIQGIYSTFIVLLLMPILLKQSNVLSWVAVEPLGFIAIRSGILALLILSVISFLPFLGKILAALPAIESFILYALIFRLMAPSYLEAILGEGKNIKGLFPSFWEVLFYLIIALILDRIVFALFIFLERIMKTRSEFVFRLLGPSLDTVVGFIVFLAYSQFVALKI